MPAIACRRTGNVCTQQKLGKGEHVRILLIDDHTLFREGIKLLLSRMEGNMEVKEADSVEDALALPPALRDFDVVLLDINLPGRHGLDSLLLLREEFPSAAVVILSGFESREAMLEAKAKGARGYLVKTVSADAMLAALRQVMAGEACFPVPSGEADAVSRISPRQQEILPLLAQGLSNKEIGRALGMSDNTVRTHLSVIFRALNVHNRTEAARVARRMGIL